MDKKTILTIIMVAIAAIGITLYFVSKAGLYVYHTKKNLQERKDIILIQVDHQQLLNACRTLLENPTTETYLKESDWPPLIKQLDPSYVASYGENDRLYIEMGGGFYSFGVIACKDGVEIETPAGYKYQQLIAGLWYYEE